ncbi:MAG: adenosylcobinamide amidohydrolase [Methanomassiliicoccaceae archaeon]|nr:adenosylcobinamide amidohydrolase [Methanomassiliicoccaceae archaeon]
MTGTWRDFIRDEEVGGRALVASLPGGEAVERQGRSLIVTFPDDRRVVLSSAHFNGGLFEGPAAVFNTTGITGEAGDSLMGKGPGEHLAYSEECARKVGLDPRKVVGLGTAVTMDKAAIVTKSSGRTSVSAIVTAGVEGNGGRAGDPASYDQLEKFQARDGTIVIILLIGADLPAHSLARAIVTATEAKTCALQQLMASSVYSTGIATGSGTDQIAVVCDSGSGVKLTDAGKHSLLGELIGKCVTEAVLRALDNWAGLNPASQRDALRRLARYKVREEDCLPSNGGEASLAALRKASRDGDVVAAIAAAIHIQDEVGWGLLAEEDGWRAAERILLGVMHEKGVRAPLLKAGDGIIPNAARALKQIAAKEQGGY